MDYITLLPFNASGDDAGKPIATARFFRLVALKVFDEFLNCYYAVQSFRSGVVEMIGTKTPDTKASYVNPANTSKIGGKLIM